MTAPYYICNFTPEDKWFDRNGHLNVAGYMHYFSSGVEEMFNQIGFGVDYTKDEDRSFFAAQQHINYSNEVHRGETIALKFHLLDFDHKRLHKFYTMYNETTGKEAATLEAIALHMNMTARKTAKFSGDRYALIEDLFDSHKNIEPHKNIARTIGLGSLSKREQA